MMNFSLLWATAPGLLLGFMPPAAAADLIETVRNERVIVVEGRIAPQETDSVEGSRPSVTVYFTAGSLQVGVAGGKSDHSSVRRGEVVFNKAQPRTVKNTGSAEVHFVRVEFPGTGSSEAWGTAGLSPNYRMLLENQYTRVYDIRIRAGATEPQHSHRDRVVICLAGAKLSHRMPDGREEPSTLKTGESTWRRGGTHIGQNLGATDLWVIAVEPK